MDVFPHGFVPLVIGYLLRSLHKVGKQQAAGTAWTTTQRPAPWCRRGESARGHDGSMLMTTVWKTLTAHSCLLCCLLRQFIFNMNLSSKLRFPTVGGRQNGYSARPAGRGGPEYDSCSSFMSSELESTSCFDSEDDDATSRSDALCSSTLCEHE